MKKYEIFKSEGGYRVCLGVHLGCPVISSSPWFGTKEEAEKAAFDAEFDDRTKDFGVFEDSGTWMYIIGGEFYSTQSESQAKAKVVKAIAQMGYDMEYIYERKEDLRL